MHIDVTGEAYQALHSLARDSDKPVEMVLGEAISLKQLAQRVQSKGGKIYFEQDGKVKVLEQA